MLIDLIFQSPFLKVDLIFLELFLDKSESVRFMAPEIDGLNKYREIVEVFTSNDYVDLTISSDSLIIEEKIVPGVFVNVGKDSDMLELLLFFDIQDLKCASDKENVLFLMHWANRFKNAYMFENVSCRIDNGNEFETYFNNDSFGPLYEELG